MASRYGVSVAQVRTKSGIDAGLISDADFLELIEDAEYRAESDINTSCIPVTKIEFSDGTETNRIRLLKNPVIKVRSVNINDTDITTDYVKVDKNSGILWLQSNAEKFYTPYSNVKTDLVRVKYDYGLLDATSTQVDISSDVSAGSSVTLSVSDSSGFSVDDYVEIMGMDGKREVFKVSSVPNGVSLVADVLSQDHESGSVLTLQQTPNVFLNLVKIIASLMGVARVVGQSFDEITGYSLGDMSVQKGEPYTQWRETAKQLNDEYNRLKQSFRIRSVVK